MERFPRPELELSPRPEPERFLPLLMVQSSPLEPERFQLPERQFKSCEILFSIKQR